MTIAKGASVSLQYTLKLEDETVVDTNAGGSPLTYTQGSGEIIPGLEKELVGMKAGESKQVVIPPEAAYGVFNPEAIQEVPKDQLPRDVVEVGAQVQVQITGGQTLEARISEVEDETVVLDFNHPLAGKTLYFDVKVLEIEQPQSS